MHHTCSILFIQDCVYVYLQKVLQGDGGSGEDVLKSGLEFERWIKLGLSSLDEPQGISAEG